MDRNLNRSNHHCGCSEKTLPVLGNKPHDTLNMTDLLTPWNRVLLEKLTSFQIVTKFPTFYGTQRFITTYTSAHHLSILSQLNPVNTPTSHFLKTHLNIILPSTPGCPKWSPSLRLPNQNPVYASPLPHMHYPSFTAEQKERGVDFSSTHTMNRPVKFNMVVFYKCL